MKRIVLLNLLFLIMMNAQAQFEIGFRLGSGVEGQMGDTKDHNYLMGFHFGLATNYGFTEYFKVQSGLVYASKGSKRMIDADLLSTDDNQLSVLRLNYVELPIDFTYTWNPGDEQIMIVVGGYGGYGVFGSVEYKLKVAGTTTTEVNDVAFVKDINEAGVSYPASKWDFGVNAGIAYRYFDFEVQASYSYGFVNTMPPQDGLDPISAINNHGVRISLLYYMHHYTL